MAKERDAAVGCGMAGWTGSRGSRSRRGRVHGSTRLPEWSRNQFALATLISFKPKTPASFCWIICLSVLDFQEFDFEFVLNRSRSFAYATPIIVQHELKCKPLSIQDNQHLSIQIQPTPQQVMDGYVSHVQHAQTALGYNSGRTPRHRLILEGVRVSHLSWPQLVDTNLQ